MKWKSKVAFLTIVAYLVTVVASISFVFLGLYLSITYKHLVSFPYAPIVVGLVGSGSVAVSIVKYVQGKS